MYANPSLILKIARRIATIVLCEGALDVKWNQINCQNPWLQVRKFKKM
jgi:hypothetical protein